MMPRCPLNKLLTNALRTPMLGRWLCLWAFCLHLGLGIAAPLIQPESWQWVCSGNGMQLRSAHDASTEMGSSVGENAHKQECSLCSPLCAGGILAPSLTLAASKQTHLAIPLDLGSTPQSKPYSFFVARAPPPVAHI